MRGNRCALSTLSMTMMLALGLAAAPAGAAVFFPNKTADTADGACDADCSLREAVVAANAAPGADVVVLGPGVYTLTRGGAGEDAAAAGDLDVGSDLTVLGAGAEATIIDGAALDRVFDVQPGVHLELIGVTVRNGRVDQGGGGAIRNAGALTLTRSVVAGSRATNGAGGGILSTGAGATLAIAASTISGNSARDGGGIAAGGAMTLVDSTVYGNSAADLGGGLYLYSRLAAELADDTIAGNRAAVDAGGVFAEGAPFIGSEVALLRNSILAGNQAPAAHHPDCLDALASGGFNLVGDPTGCIDFQAAKSDLTGTAGTPLDPRLGPLAANGGPTPTLAPRSASLAIGNGNPAPPGSGGGACEAADQRGEARGGAAGRCDIGAFEVTGGCVPGPQTLCLSGGRFQVTAHWATAKANGDAGAVPLTGDTGYFWFFDPANVELTVKVLDACVGFDRYWAFLSGLTNVKVDVTVTDTASGKAKVYSSPLGQTFAPKLDTDAFATCP